MAWPALSPSGWCHIRAEREPAEATRATKTAQAAGQQRPDVLIRREAWVEQALVPQLCPGDVVVMVSRSRHKGAAVRALIAAAGAELPYPPPDSADFTPIENLLVRAKALPRNEAARTIATLPAAIGRTPAIVTPRACQRMFAAAGYDPGW